MRRLLYISALVFLAVLTGCADRERVSARLDALDSLQSLPPTGPEPPVNYGLILTQLDTLLPDVVGDDALEARWNLLCATAEDKADRPLLSDLRIRPAYDYYREATQEGTCGDSTLLHRFAQSCFYLGVHYYHLDSTARLEQLMQKSVEVAKSCNDHYTAYLVLAYLSRSLMHSNPEESIRVAQEALTEYGQSNHQSIYNEAIILVQLGFNYIYNWEQDKALDCFTKALQISEQGGEVLTEKSAFYGLSYYYFCKKDYARALSYLEQYTAGKDFTKDESSAFLAVNIYMQTDSLAKAYEYIRQYLPQLNTQRKFYSYLTLQKIALRQHKYDESTSLVDSIRKYADEMHADEMRENFNFFQDNIEKERANVRLAMKNARQRSLFLVVGIVAFFTLCIISLFILQSRRRHRHLLAREKMRRQMAGERESYHQSLTALQLQVKETAIEQKDRKLSYLKCYIEKQSKTIELFKSGEAGEHMSLTDEDWQSLEIALDDSYDNFILKLRTSFPQMKEEMVRLCMLQKISMTNRAIGNIFFITPDSVKKRKQRWKKEFFPDTPKEVTFEEIIDRSVDFIQ